MPAARDQAQEGRVEGLELRQRQEVGRDVSLQVIHGRKRQPPRGRQRLRRRETDEQRADQPGTLRDRDQIDLVELAFRLLERVLHDEVDQPYVMTRGDLRHDATEALVHELRGDHVRAHLSPAPDHRRAGVVAARLDPQDESHVAGGPAHAQPAFGTSASVPARVPGVRHITSASSPLSW